MFSGNKKQAISRSLGMSLPELDNFVKRYRGHINAKLQDESVSKNVILGGLWLIEAVKQEELSQRIEKRKAINFGSMTNTVIRKYGLKILELKDNGYGAQRISKHLDQNHNAKVSKATIERFIKLNEV